MTTWLAFDRFQGSSPHVLALLGVLTILEWSAKGAPPTLEHWRQRYVEWGAGLGPAYDQFNGAFPFPFRQAVQLKVKSANYANMCGFLSNWLSKLRDGTAKLDLDDAARAKLQLQAQALALDPNCSDLIAAVRARDLDGFINEVCRPLSEEPHPWFSFCKALEPIAVKTALYGAAPGVSPIFGCYGVVREARGWFPRSTRPSDRGRLVRDVMFVRPNDIKRVEEDEDISADYYSALDNEVYTLGRSQWGDKVSWFEGNESRDGTAMHVVSSSLDRTRTHPHLALLCGSTRMAGRPAAWKALVSRHAGPNPEKVEAALLLTADSHVNKSKVVAFLHEEGVLGNLGDMTESACGSPATQVFRRYAVLMPTQEVKRALDEICGAAIRDAISALVASHGVSHQGFVDAATAAVLEAVREKWPWLESAQTILTLPNEFRGAHELGGELPAELGELFVMPATPPGPR